MFNEININCTQFDITFEAEAFKLSPSCLAYSAFYFDL